MLVGVDLYHKLINKKPIRLPPATVNGDKKKNKYKRTIGLMERKK